MGNNNLKRKSSESHFNLTSDISTFDIFKKLCSGSKDYNYSTIKSLSDDVKRDAFEIKSNIDQKFYAGKVMTILPPEHLR